MTSILNKKGKVAVTVLFIAILFSGCSRLNDKPVADYLDLALAGMAGSDGVTFEVATVLLRGSDGTPYESIYYGGTMEEHHKVSLYSLAQDASTSTASSALPLLNPVQLLEELEGLNKTVTEETGAGRGNRFLRIELTPEESLNQLVTELNRELSSLRGSQELGNPQLDRMLDAFWKKQDTELQRKLDNVQVETIYHLIVDSRRNLPKRLACTRTVSFPGSAEKQMERYVSQIDFYGYR